VGFFVSGEKMKTYPVNLVLENQRIVLVGGNAEIARKIPGLLEVGARVRVIAPEVHADIQQYAAEGQIEWLPRPYQPGDLTGAALTIACTSDQQVHDAVWAEGRANGQLVNVMDVIPQCNFHAVSTLRRGQLTISIGTGGAAPALAVTLRKRFEQEFGPEYAEFLDYTQTLRPVVAKRLPFENRIDFWYALVESEALSLLRQGQHSQFEDCVEQLLTHYEEPPVVEADNG
jgi:precorrin-2 dehydrogenase/sirohydrochlorin ferrochelatase